MRYRPEPVHFFSSNVSKSRERESFIRAHCNSDKGGEEVPAASAAHQAPRSRSLALTLQGEAPSELEPSLTGRSYGMGRGLVREIWGLQRERKMEEREVALSLYSRAGSVHSRHMVLSDRELHRNSLFTNFY